MARSAISQNCFKIKRKEKNSKAKCGIPEKSNTKGI